jgi:hypothetical protein
VDVGKVYEKLKDAKNINPLNTTKTLRVSKSTKAIRVGMDRLARIGERIREDNNVSVRDHRLMAKEAIELKEDINSVYQTKMDDAMIADQFNDLNLNEAPGQFQRIVDAIFRGEMKVTDKMDRVGSLLDEEMNPALINFEGDFALEKAKNEYSRRDATDVLSEGDRYGIGIQTLALGGEVEGRSYVESAVERIRAEYLTKGTSLVEMHTDASHFTNLSLLFDDD